MGEGTTLRRRVQGCVLCGYWFWLLMVSPASWGDAACRVNDDCQYGRTCLFKAYANRGQCSAFLPAEGLAEETRRALPLPIPDRQVGDACEFSVDCLPGYGCFFAGSFSLLGICLPDRVDADDR